MKAWRRCHSLARAVGVVSQVDSIKELCKLGNATNVVAKLRLFGQSVSPSLYLFHQRGDKNSNFENIIIILNNYVLCEYILKYNLFLWWIFSIITPVYSVTWSIRNHSNMICCSRNISYQCWIELCSFIFLWRPKQKRCKNKILVLSVKIYLYSTVNSCIVWFYVLFIKQI